MQVETSAKRAQSSDVSSIKGIHVSHLGPGHVVRRRFFKILDDRVLNDTIGEVYAEDNSEKAE